MAENLICPWADQNRTAHGAVTIGYADARACACPSC